jgi:hypothetical protein
MTPEMVQKMQAFVDAKLAELQIEVPVVAS